MSSINPEMLKQLLSEFEEKQMVCSEEINAITDQIAELEKRITESKERLVSVARDREKIGLMKQRYADGDWSSVLSNIQRNGSNSNNNNDSRTGDYPPVVVPQPPAEVAPPMPAPPQPQPQQAAFASPPQQAVEMPMPMPAESIPNPFEQPPPLLAQPQQAFQMETSWEPQQQPFPEPQPQPAPAPAQAAPPQAAPPQSEGLFPFSGQPPADGEGADIPWAPPPSMTWESVGSHTFPGQQGGQPDQPQQPFQQPPAQQPSTTSFVDPNQFAQQAPPQAQMPGMGMDLQLPAGFGDPGNAPQPGPPAGFMTAPPAPVPPQNPQAVLTTAFDEEFDISDALRGEDESNPDSRDNDKKIKDALRGLFS